MPVSNQANAVAIRSPGHVIPCFASFYPGSVVASGTIASQVRDPMDVSYANLVVTYVTGAYTDVQQGMEITLHDPITDALKGRTHVRFDGTGATIGGVIPVREYAVAALTLTAGDVFKVWKEYRLHDKLVAATANFGGFPPDIQVYSDQGSNPPPIACDGGHWAGDTSQLPIQLTGSNSYTVDPDSAGTVTHARTLPTGLSFASGSGSSANPTLTGDPGIYLYDHTVTDSSNSKATPQHIIVMIHDPDENPAHQVEITDYRGTAEAGWNWAVEVTSGDTDQAAIPDGCWCILWSTERIAGTQQSFRNVSPGRSHIIGVGIVRRDTIQGDTDGLVTCSLEVISPHARLREVTSYSKVMEENATPDAWSEIKTLKVKRAAIQLWQFYTTGTECGLDLIFDSSFVNPTYPTFYLQRSTFYDQLKELADGVDGRLTCDRSGRMGFHTAPPYLPLADRAAITKPFRWKPQDVISYQLTREHYSTLEQIKVSGISAGSSNNRPCFSLAPGAAPDEGIDTPARERLIADETTPQDNINERSGRYYAEAAGVYVDSDDIRHRAFQLQLTLRGVYDFLDFDLSYYDFEQTLPDLPRDLDLTDFLFYLVSSNTRFEGGTSETEVVLAVATHAPPGETFTPESVPTPPIETPDPAPITDPNPANRKLLRGTGKIALFMDDSTMRRTANFTAVDPDYTNVNLTTLTNWVVTDVSVDVVQKVFSPDTVWIASRDKIYLLDSIATPTSVTVQHSFAASCTSRMIQTERCSAVWAICASYYPSVGLKVAYTTNGTSWTETGVIGAAETSGAGQPNAIWMSPTTPGLARVATMNAAASGHGTLRVYQSTDYGATWTEITTYTISSVGRPAIGIEVPYNDPSTMYVTVAVFDSGSTYDLKVYRVVGTTVSDVTPTYSGTPYGARDRRSLRSWDTDGRRMVLIGDADNQTDVIGVFTTKTGVADLSPIVVPASGNANLYNNAWIGGDGLALYVGGYAGYIWASDDFGETPLVSKVGAGIGSGRVLQLVGWG